MPETERNIRLPWSPRTAIILAPVHILAFILLYFTVFHLTVHEISVTYKNETDAYLTEAVRRFHTAMQCSPESNIKEGLEKLAFPNNISGLELYDARGRPVSAGTLPLKEVAQFLQCPEEKDVRIRAESTATTLTALARIRATGECRPCHQEGAVLGALAVRRDLTAALDGARRRTGFGLALLIGGWLLVVALLDILTRRFARATMDRIRLRVRQPADASELPRTPLSLECFSGELYRKLEETLRHQEQERAGLEDHPGGPGVAGRGLQE